jgi:hypothetical protein
MKRFEFEDGGEDENLFSGDEGEEISAEYLRLLEKKELVEVLKTQLFQKEINQELLLNTIKYLEKSFFWTFKSNSTKLQLIMETYELFKTLVDLDTLVIEEDDNPTENK